MAQDLRQNTNSQIIKAGPMVSNSDFVTLQTTLVLSQADVLLAKDAAGVAYAAKNDASDSTYDAVGEYNVTLNATDSNTLGMLKLRIEKIGCLPYWKEFNVLSQAAYDAKYSATAPALKTDTDAILAAVNGQGPVATVPTSASNVISGVVVAGTYLNTQTLDGSVWSIRGTGSVAAVLELIYATGAVTNKPVRIDLNGYYNVSAPTGSKACTIWAWNYNPSIAAYVQVSNSTTQFSGTTGTTIVPKSIILSTDFIDPATGNAKIKLIGSDVATNSIIAIDYAPYYYQSGGNTLTDIAKAVWQYNPYIAYAGQITIDTVNGFAGQDLGINGLPTYGSNNIEDAVVLAGKLGVRRFNSLTESLLVLNQTYNGWIFDGWEFYVNMNGQTLTDTAFRFCHVFGVGTCGGDSDMHFDSCYIASSTSGDSNATICMGVLRKCILVGSITLASGNNIFDECVDGTNSLSTPIIVMSDSAEAQFRKYSGGIQFNNMTAGNDVLIDGMGRVIIHSNCTGGKITIRGFFGYPKDENGDMYSGPVTIVQTERVSTDQILAKVIDGTETIESAMKKILAMAVGNSTKSGTQVTFNDQENAPLYTYDVTNTNRTRI